MLLLSRVNQNTSNKPRTIFLAQQKKSKFKSPHKNENEGNKKESRIQNKNAGVSFN